MDIRLPIKESIPQGLSPKPARRRVDFVVLFDLIESLIETGQVVVVFLDSRLQWRLYKRARKAGVSEERIDALRAVLRDEPGHDDHIHVRFRCGPAETECVALVPAGEAWRAEDETGSSTSDADPGLEPVNP